MDECVHGYKKVAWKLKKADEVPGWPELNVTRAGQRMIHENDARTVEVGVVAANDLEKEVLVKRILDAAQEGQVQVGTGAEFPTEHQGEAEHQRSDAGTPSGAGG